MVSIDGTYTRIPYFSDMYLTAVTLDSNRQVQLLAVARVDKENTENWLWFLKLLKSKFLNCYDLQLTHLNLFLCEDAFPSIRFYTQTTKRVSKVANFRRNW